MADMHRVQTHAAHYQPRTSDAARAMDGRPSMTDQSHTPQQLADLDSLWRFQESWTYRTFLFFFKKEMKKIASDLRSCQDLTS